MIQEILNSIDLIDDITTEYTVNTMNSMIDSYEKSALILENYEGDDLSSFTIFQEGEIMDDVKKQGQGQSTLMKILSFIPRLIKAIFHKIKKAISKGETPAAVNKELQKAPKEVKKALPILFDNKKDKKSKVSMIKKILIGAGTVGAVAAAAVVGKNAMSKSKKKNDDSSSSTNKVTEALTKLKNALKIRTKTKKKLEEAEQELSQSEKKLSKKDDNKIVKQPPVAGNIEEQKKIVKKLQEEADDNTNDIEKFIADCIEIMDVPDESHLLVYDDQIDENLYNDIMTEIKKLEAECGERFQNLSKLTSILKAVKDKKIPDEIDKIISRLVNKYESAQKSLVSDIEMIYKCMRDVYDKNPVGTSKTALRHLKRNDEVVNDLKSGNINLMELEKDGNELKLVNRSSHYLLSIAQKNIAEAVAECYKFLADVSEQKEIPSRIIDHDNGTYLLMAIETITECGPLNFTYNTPTPIYRSDRDLGINSPDRGHGSRDKDATRIYRGKMLDEETSIYFKDAIDATMDIVKKLNDDKKNSPEVGEIVIFIGSLSTLMDAIVNYTYKLSKTAKQLLGDVNAINKKLGNEMIILKK